MPTDIILPTLTVWAQGALTGLLESKTQEDFDGRFESMFARVVNVTVNGKHLSREQYKQELLDQSAAGPTQQSATLSVSGQLEVEQGDQGQLEGLVGLFYTSNVFSKFLVLGFPAEIKVTSSLNLVVAPKGHEVIPPHTVGGDYDSRRITTVNQIITEQTYHVTLPNLPTGTVSGVTTKPELGPGPVKLPPHFGPGPVKLPPQ
ncbi:hypothetical protein CONPUDRAFT_99654 [Coniophora puteana RWD-64-598 SS2]|uniref:Uncharacterized protein n=1 Tax=Coniophora puteana (strain RWD-64-598) TaxID=741705 RepID=A0A5M3MXW4_CONPW|nr:uncharacterized protein CONPUDRAFT_99654 [Coniophora puteana RWD-64-598 SS2]EIW83968.1 hypothetical protein CONPUDRAFT_99654 [Coniophora puteana RWD-64-598 SS2]